MKRLLIMICVLVFIFSNAQEENSEMLNSDRRKDVMINPIALVLGAGNLSYEYHLNKDSGLGISTFFIYDKYVLDSDVWYVMPYYRYYFGKKWARGFFLDGFAGMINSNNEGYIYYKESDGTMGYRPKENEISLGFGIGLGGKWELKKNLVFEVSLGIGRNISNTNDPTFGKGMLGLGYRF